MDYLQEIPIVINTVILGKYVGLRFTLQRKVWHQILIAYRRKLIFTEIYIVFYDVIGDDLI